MNFLFRSLLPLFLAGFMISCGGDEIVVDSEDGDGTDIDVISNHVLDSMSSLNTAINGKMFSIPSPIQMATLIKSKVGVFNENMLTNPENVSTFTTNFKRAINMGVYGADLGYATIYENNTKAISYLSSIEKLSDELGIAGAFNQSLLERFIENGNNPDSMLTIMSEGYREGDKFLKDNEQHDVATLILTGGWIEGLYFATTSYETSNEQAIADRIGEQRTGLKTIIELLQDYNSDEFYSKLIADLQDLLIEFNKIKFNYTFIEPVHDPANHQTNIKSKSSVNIDPAVLTSIITKVKAIRNGLIS
ncbi:MAG: hypothetical protein IPO32_16845 [Crocinitomicaceae bacterium]|jgi:hypothetical protein|nr:hypothetical protein [Crocinitomicaceae bacterium]MBK6953276.1 hypothetical protein [Crocinitomicaceae bacterium]MBK9593086.1 hypothetical protein [Crocinitomicaceae bacterium]